MDGFVWKDSDKLQATSCKPKAQIRSQKIRSQEPAVYGLVWWDGFILGAQRPAFSIQHSAVSQGKSLGQLTSGYCGIGGGFWLVELDGFILGAQRRRRRSLSRAAWTQPGANRYPLPVTRGRYLQQRRCNGALDGSAGLIGPASADDVPLPHAAPPQRNHTSLPITFWKQGVERHGYCKPQMYALMAGVTPRTRGRFLILSGT